MHAIIDQVAKYIPPFGNLDPLVKIDWIGKAVQLSKKRGSLLFIPNDVGKNNMYLIVRGYVSIFIYLQSNPDRPVFVQTYGEGELINERSCLTPFATDH